LVLGRQWPQKCYLGALKDEAKWNPGYGHGATGTIIGDAIGDSRSGCLVHLFTVQSQYRQERTVALKEAVEVPKEEIASTPS